MQIKPSEGTSAPRPTSTRPAAAGQLALEARANNVLVSLSGTVRALATALTRELLDLPALQLGDRLTGADRLTLARVSELAQAEQIDPSEVVKLALDLSRYRAADTTRPAAPVLLELPAFSPRDESLARTILASVALRGSALERGFVQALLDPDQTPQHAADFAFVRRVVVALSGVSGGDALDPGVTFERRDARATLARAIAGLALPRAALPAALAEHAELGASLVRRYLPAALASSDPAGAGLRSASDRYPLTRDDRTLLSVLYAAAYARGQDLSAVDDVARALVRLRHLERAAAPEFDPAAPQAEPFSLEPRPFAPRLGAPGAAMPPALPALAPRMPHATAATGVGTPPALLTPTALGAPEPAAPRAHSAPTARDAPGPAALPAQSTPPAPSAPEPAAPPPELASAPVQHELRDTQAREPSPVALPHESEPRAAPEARVQTPDVPPARLAAETLIHQQTSLPAMSAHPQAQAIPGEHASSRAMSGLSPPHAEPPPSASEPWEAPAPARNFGSAAQLAARAGSMYRSLAPPSLAAAGVPASEVATAAPFPAQRAAPLPLAPQRPLDLAGALGLSALVRDVRARTSRARLPARRTNVVRPIEAPARAASDADDAVLDDPRERKRVRWRLLLSRRRRARSRGR